MADSMAVARSMLRAIYTAYPVSVQAAWSVADVRSALETHEQGSFNQTSMMVDAMGRDDRIPGVLSTRILGLIQLPFELQLADEIEGSEGQPQKVRDELQRDWQSIFPETEVAELMKWYLMLGVGLAQLVWETKADKWLPRLRVMHPQYLRYDESAGKWLYNTTDGEILIEPGNGKWVLLIDGERGYMNGFVRSLSVPWLMRQYNWRDWARSNERHGMPIIKAMVPAVADGDEKADFVDDIRALSTETTMMLPQGLTEDGQGFDVQLLEAQSSNYQTFTEMRMACDTAIAVDVLGQNLSTEIVGGSYAAAIASAAILAQRVRADAQRLSSVLREQVLVPTVAVNWGDDQDLVPWPSWDIEPPKDTAAEVDVIGKLLSAIEASPNTARLLDVSSILERFGVPMADEVEEADERGTVYKYHLDFGVLTKNEIRQRLGMPPIAGGDVPPEPMVQSGTEETALTEASEAKAQGLPGKPHLSQLQRVKLASGASATKAKGYIEGQLYVDAVTDDALAASEPAIQSDLSKLLAAVEASKDYDDLRDRLRRAYAATSPLELSQKMEQAMVLWELAGQMSVLRDS